jgi:hypothetical protein
MRMHDITSKSHWHEPSGGKKAGFGRFQEAEDAVRRVHGVGRHSLASAGLGFKRAHDLQLEPWKRTGGRGTYVQLYGTETSGVLRRRSAGSPAR